MPFPHTCGLRRGLLSHSLKSVRDSTRTYLDPCKHNLPDKIKWQWAVKDNPDSDCKYACVSKHCPKPSFFPRFSKRFVPKQLKSCEEEPKPMTWGEYFSYLLPDSMQEEQKILGQCRELAKTKSMRPPRTVGSPCGGQGNECTVRVPMTAYQTTKKTNETLHTKEPKPCPPPESVAPRCVLVQNGICPQQKKQLDMSQYVAPLPYEEIRIGFARPTTEPQVFSQKCSRKCQPSVPAIVGKGAQLSCRYYAEFKTVECPKSMFTRFKSGPPKGPCPEKTASPNLPPTSTNIEKAILNPGIKKGSCTPNLNKRELHTGNNAARAEGNAEHGIMGVCPNDKGVLIPQKREGMADSLLNRVIKKVLSEGGGRALDTWNPSLNASRGMATFTKRPIRRLQKKKKDCEEEEEPPPKPICAGCAGVREAMRPKKPIDIVKRVIDCRQRPQGTCPGPQRRVYPDEPPPNNPYYRNKATTFSLCNKPRQKPCRKPPKWEGACKEQEYHTAATPRLLSPNNTRPPSSQQRYSTLSIHYLLSRQGREGRTITTGQVARGEKGEEAAKGGDEAKAGEEAKGGDAKPAPTDAAPKEEESIYKKFDPHTVKRESCARKGGAPPPPPNPNAAVCPPDGQGTSKTE